MLVKIEVVTNYSDAQNRHIGGLLMELVSVHDRKTGHIKITQGSVCDTSGAAWSRLVAIELNVKRLNDDAVTRLLDEACLSYRKAQGPLFSMNWASPNQRSVKGVAHPLRYPPQE